MQHKSSIQELATAARRRIQNGYKRSVMERQHSVSSVGEGSYDKAGLSIFTETDCYRIYAVLQEDDGISPIAKLIDRGYFSTLTPTEQQRYVFRLSEAYIFLKTQLESNQRYLP